MKPQGRIFISYRRESGAELARNIYQNLRERGYSAFMDVEDLRSGPFNTALFKEIDASTDFILILTPNCLDRCSNPADWVRLEVAHAIKTQKNLIPVRTRGFSYPPQPLPEDINQISVFQGLEHSHEIFKGSMDKLSSLLHAKPRKQSVARLIMALAIIVILSISVWMCAKGSFISGRTAQVAQDDSLQTNTNSQIAAVAQKQPLTNMPAQNILQTSSFNGIWSFDFSFNSGDGAIREMGTVERFPTGSYDMTGQIIIASPKLGEIVYNVLASGDWQLVQNALFEKQAEFKPVLNLSKTQVNPSVRAFLLSGKMKLEDILPQKGTQEVDVMNVTSNSMTLSIKDLKGNPIQYQSTKQTARFQLD